MKLINVTLGSTCCHFLWTGTYFVQAIRVEQEVHIFNGVERIHVKFHTRYDRIGRPSDLNTTELVNESIANNVAE